MDLGYLLRSVLVHFTIHPCLRMYTKGPATTRLSLVDSATALANTPSLANDFLATVPYLYSNLSKAVLTGLQPSPLTDKHQPLPGLSDKTVLGAVEKCSIPVKSSGIDHSLETGTGSTTSYVSSGDVVASHRMSVPNKNAASRAKTRTCRG